jgi:peptidoglycan/LPS O-acetylase OafA/YrhL
MPPPTALSDAAALRTEPATAPGSSTAVVRDWRERGERLGGLDGLRAIAVAAVVLFHLDSSVVPGGFLGVDVFFVISGFLITRLLLTELHRTDTIALGAFYRRRARRLFPSVAVLAFVVSAASVFVWRDELDTLRGNVLSSLGYVTNWWLIFDHQSYFASSGRPPMLQHLWSLAIEEQYYLIWPILILGVAALTRVRWRPDLRLAAVAWLAVGLAVLSAVAMAVIAVRSDVPYASDSSRVYFGTDTHSTGLFLGSAAGAWNVLRTGRARSSRLAFLWFTDLLGALALLLLGWEFLHLDEFRPALYRGGFVVLDTLALIAVCAVIRPGSGVGWLLDRGALRWIGQRSYAIYLWHWPVVVVTRPGIDVHGPLLLVNLARAGLILLLAELSYRFVENPIRYGGWAARPKREPSSLVLRLPAISTVACIAVLWLAAGPGTTRAAAPPTPNAAVPGTAAATLRAVQPTASTSASTSASASASTAPLAPPTSAASVAAPPPPVPVSGLSAFGDSVLLGAAPALVKLDGKASVDAVEGRQAYVVLDDVVSQHQKGQLGPVVVIHTGNNGVIKPAQLASVLAELADRRRVVLLTDKVPRDWQDPNNATLTAVAGQFANVRVVDWLTISSAHPEWFYADGLHLKPNGAAAYAQLIMSAAAG